MADQISTIDGVAQVVVFGAQKYAVRIQLDPQALASRLGALTLFYLIETADYFTGLADRDFHLKASAVAAAWIVASILCQRLVGSRRWSIPACFVWGMLDSLSLLALLRLGHGAASALVVGYPLVIVASGLWFRVRFVWFMTFLSLLSYGLLVIDFYYWRPFLQYEMHVSFSRHAIFAVALLINGAVVAYLVRQVRTLSSFYGRSID